MLIRLATLGLSNRHYARGVGEGADVWHPRSNVKHAFRAPALLLPAVSRVSDARCFRMDRSSSGGRMDRVSYILRRTTRILRRHRGMHAAAATRHGALLPRRALHYYAPRIAHALPASLRPLTAHGHEKSRCVGWRRRWAKPAACCIVAPLFVLKEQTCMSVLLASYSHLYSLSWLWRRKRRYSLCYFYTTLIYLSSPFLDSHTSACISVRRTSSLLSRSLHLF